ncbi:sugar transferase [Alphaproteobacteria bacterium KMM 3653]|uniref:Sugar transferase n=1 Tax=Harenicola maris TaxID=2841044 RepID=A0AAP2G8R6_9RHOB|nr:sugar transferase [Harenicola maris]
MAFRDIIGTTVQNTSLAPSSVSLNGNKFYRSIGKRSIDIILSLLALPLVFLILSVVWVVGQFSGGQVFFAQDRVGKNGRVFRCFKVRSMVINAEEVLQELCASDPKIAEEWEQFQKLQNDPRINRWGAFLRKTSIDELPQFLNVLRGDMSLVGPRPFMVSQTEIYQAGGGRHYFSMQPGITGNWQVEGRGDTSFLSRIAYDRLYSQNMSLSEDLRLLGRTAQVLLRMSGR